MSGSENEVLGCLVIFLWADSCQHGVRTNNYTYHVSSFCQNVVEAFTLLEYNIIQVGGWLPSFWESLSVLSSSVILSGFC